MSALQVSCIDFLLTTLRLPSNQISKVGIIDNTIIIMLGSNKMTFPLDQTMKFYKSSLQ